MTSKTTRSVKDSGIGKYSTGWSSISVCDLEAIIKSSEILIDAGVEMPSNYEELLMATIYLRQKKSWGKYDLNYAIDIALLWKEKFPIDVSAIFMLGALFLAHGLQTADHDRVRNGMKYLRLSSRLCLEHPMNKCIEMLRFVIVNGKDSCALIPYEINCLENISLEQKFLGRLCGKNVLVRPFKNIIAASVFGDCLRFSEQGPLLQFHIGLRYHDPVVAINDVEYEHDF